jgi:pilus assembly protein CpaB
MKARWIAAAVLGLAAGVMHLLYVRALEAKVTGGEEVEVLVTAQPIAAGTPLEMGAVATRRVPSAFVDERVVLSPRVKEVVGLSTAVGIEGGQMVLWSDFEERPDPGEEDLSRLVEPGHRAMAIPVDGSLSMGGALRPGHRVDILGTFSRGKERGPGADRVTVTLLQNVTVLATGRELSGGAGRYGTVTLSVGLEESELLAFSATQGTLALVLRGEQDLTVVRDVPEKGMDDVWEAERRNALQDKPRGEQHAIERLKVR